MISVFQFVGLLILATIQLALFVDFQPESHSNYIENYLKKINKINSSSKTTLPNIFSNLTNNFPPFTTKYPNFDIHNQNFLNKFPNFYQESENSDQKIIQKDRIQRFEHVCKILRSMNQTFDRQISFLEDNDDDNLNLNKEYRNMPTKSSQGLPALPESCWKSRH